MDRLKLYRIVEYVKQFEKDFCFDVADVVDDVDRVLYFLGVCEEITSEEREVLVDELVRIAERREFSEVERLVFEEEEELLLF